jgi:hypothetical protein
MGPGYFWPNDSTTKNRKCLVGSREEATGTTHMSWICILMGVGQLVEHRHVLWSNPVRRENGFFVLNEYFFLPRISDFSTFDLYP